MNKRIKELAEQAGVTFDSLGASYTFGSLQDFLERFAELVAAAEREACAKLCESKMIDEYATGKVDHNEQSWTAVCAAAIRARSKHEHST